MTRLTKINPRINNTNNSNNNNNNVREDDTNLSDCEIGLAPTQMFLSSWRVYFLKY